MKCKCPVCLGFKVMTGATITGYDRMGRAVSERSKVPCWYCKAQGWCTFNLGEYANDP